MNELVAIACTALIAICLVVRRVVQAHTDRVLAQKALEAARSNENAERLHLEIASLAHEKLNEAADADVTRWSC